MLGAASRTARGRTEGAQHTGPPCIKGHGGPTSGALSGQGEHSSQLPAPVATLKSEDYGRGRNSYTVKVEFMVSAACESRVGTYRALKGQGRLEAVQRAPNTQVHPASRAMEAHQGDGVLYSQGESYVGRVQWTSWRQLSMWRASEPGGRGTRKHS